MYCWCICESTNHIDQFITFVILLLFFFRINTFHYRSNMILAHNAVSKLVWLHPFPFEMMPKVSLHFIWHVTCASGEGATNILSCVHNTSISCSQYHADRTINSTHSTDSTSISFSYTWWNGLDPSTLLLAFWTRIAHDPCNIIRCDECFWVV